MQVDKEHSRLEDTIKRSSATGKVQNQPSIVVTPVYSSRASRHGESAPHLTPLLRDMSDGLHSRPPVVLSARSVCVCVAVSVAPCSYPCPRTAAFVCLHLIQLINTYHPTPTLFHATAHTSQYTCYAVLIVLLLSFAMFFLIKIVPKAS